MSEQGNRPWWWWAGVLLAVAVGISLLVRLGRHDLYTQDTTAIIDGANRSLACVREGVFRACRYHPETSATDVNPYPLLQYLPATALAALGASDDLNRNVLIWGNAAAIALLVGIVVERGRRLGGVRLAVAAAVAMLTGMLLPYAGQSFGEPLVMLAVVVVCRLAVARRATPWLLPAAALATTGKETMFPVVVLFAAGFALLGAERGPEAAIVVRRKAVWVLGGVGLGVAANLAFNVFRFGGTTNVQYLLEARPGPAAAVVNTVSLLVAPNGGLLWFWWTAVAALVVVVVAVLAPRLVAGPAADDPVDRRRLRLGALAVAAGFGVGLVSLGFWWGPFGWYSWGPRLLLPFVPAVVLAAVELLGRRPAGEPLPRGWVLAGAATTAVAVVLLVPALGEVWAPESWNVHQVATVAERPACGTVDLRGPEGYGPFHECLMAMAWRTSAMPLVESVRGATGADPVWFWATVAAAMAAIGFWVAVARAAPRTSGRAAAPRGAGSGDVDVG
ncbi:MAG: hypothetical protein U0Q07_15720 [Acidimicrobiales bacterium]